jgi:hypothetical protein
MKFDVIVVCDGAINRSQRESSMSDPCTLKKLRVYLLVCIGLGLATLSGVSQPVPSSQGPPSFQGYFNSLSNAPRVRGSKDEADYLNLIDAIATMSPSEISLGLPVLDRRIDNHLAPTDSRARYNAAMMLYAVSARPDGSDLLALETTRLASMLNDPGHLLSGPALMTLTNIGIRRTNTIVPILADSLKRPDVNNSTGVGPGIATALERMAPNSGEALGEIAQYMRRPDLTDKNLIDTIIGITSGPAIPDVLAAEFVRCLDRPNDRIKERALIGLSKSSRGARDLARPRIQRMSSDSAETEQVKHIATEALEGRVTEDPERQRIPSAQRSQ